ncbi:MAG TPA: response regulator [bacterium]|jgi:CheY-like chemotaxis protein|nr:response regulator [bacterium]
MANLLIVDDNPGLREGISSFFEGQGHQSIMAGGVREAVEIVRKRPPDLILSDLIMGDGTGVALRKEIRGLGLRHDPYFILLTGYPTQDNAHEAYMGGVDLYLTKPFQLPALALAVDNALRKRSVHEDPILRPAESFYHDFFLALNPVLPRLLMLMEGRYGGLGPEQVACMSSIFESWRALLWTMGDFYQRLNDPASGAMERRRWSGPAALRRCIDKLQKDFSEAQLRVEVGRESRLPLGFVHPPTAEALLEALLLRLAAFSAPGATLFLTWSTVGKRLLLSLRSDLGHPDLSAELMRHAALLPPVLPLLEEAGVRVIVTDSVGPWTLSFDGA